MKLLQILFTPYVHKSEINDSWIVSMHESIIRERSRKSLEAMRDNIDKLATFHVSGIIRDRLIHLYEFAQYRLNLMGRV